MISANVGLINISIETFDADKFEYITNNKQFDSFKNNLLTLEEKKKKKEDIPEFRFITMLLKENKDVTVQNQLYKDIIKYNSKLRKNKHYSKSLWTNWFYPDGWDELEYIEIK